MSGEPAIEETTDCEDSTAPRSVSSAALGLAATLAREGLKMTALPVLVLPPSLRRGVLGTARLASQASGKVLPRPLGNALANLADDIDGLGSAVSNREDLGSRLRREERHQETTRSAARR
ncbi:MAG: hypothetical protein K0U98_03105 [Deltaproteobacteria bacterium]|nr:hypothetical protein [Deltaproteobacteria bacterium]